MSNTIESEAPPRVSVDTVIEEPPAKQLDDVEMAEQGIARTRREEAQGTPAQSLLEEVRSPRVDETPIQRVEWRQIRDQLGMGPEERRVEWEHIRDQLGLSDDDEESASLLKQIAQACLVLATTPFMLLHGVFKMIGALLRSLGMIFTGLGKLAGKLTYKPKKGKRRPAGPIQI